MRDLDFIDDEGSSTARYRTQRRGGKGVRDIKTTARNGKVIGISRVDEDDEVLIMTARGKLQRIASSDISVIGRNTQGVRIMSLDDDDKLAAIVRVPKEDQEDTTGVDGPTSDTLTSPEDSSASDTPEATPPEDVDETGDDEQ